jgi:uncharacterized cupredoxin-like copper-binding protein
VTVAHLAKVPIDERRRVKNSRPTAIEGATVQRRSRILAFVTLLALGSALVGGCGGEVQDATLASVTPARTEVIELRDISYSVTRIDTHRDEVVDLELRGVGALIHDFTVDVMPVDKLVIGHNATIHAAHIARFALIAGPEIGETVTLRIRPTKSGTYTFYCATEGHRAAGMTGTIVVQ